MGGQGQAGRGPHQREIKLISTSMVREVRVEDPNVWKPKHAVKAKDKEDPEKAITEVSDIKVVDFRNLLDVGPSSYILLFF